MILEFHSSLINNGLSDDEISQLSALLRLRRTGKAFFIASNKLLDDLQSIDLAGHDIGNIKKIMSDQVQWRNWLKGRKNRVVLTSYCLHDNSELSRETGFLHVHFMNFECIEPTIIAEHSRDVDYFLKVTEEYLRNVLNIKGAKVGARNRLGGGATIYEVINNHQDNNEGLAYCIIDSDKTNPGSQLGGTAQKVIDEVTNNLFTRIRYTDSREVENLLPFDLIKKVLTSRPHRLKVDSYKKLKDFPSNENSSIKYIDLKKGLKKSAPRYNDCEVNKTYWTNVLTKLGQVCDCNCVKIKSCTCVVIDGFGSDLLKSVIDYLKQNNFNFFEKEEHCTQELLFFAEDLLPYTVSPLATAS